MPLTNARLRYWMLRIMTAGRRRSLLIATLVLIACTDRTPTGPTSDPAPVPPGAGNALLRVRCEKSAERSKVSVDGNNLAPGTYRASVRSGVNLAMSMMMATRGDEVGFDFDSEADDVANGAIRIAPDFIQGGRVEATLLQSSGQVVANTVAACSWQ